ncbi:hypothetical protein LA080_003271 [Diaporthe eres]|uniref:Uncharacterized protein n=1 Tax=Diaporthe vaccinii TaxID=105482 RepID=A0ABR4EYL8_9PEZI|nr:hypothetical protein LA080_003271 [Diaporthe eres]
MGNSSSRPLNPRVSQEMYLGGGHKRLNPLVASAGEARKIEGGRTNSPTRRSRAPDNRRVIGGYPKHYHW